MKFNKVLKESKSVSIINEATIETVIRSLKAKEQQKKGLLKTEKYFNDADLRKLFSEFGRIDGASKDTLIPLLRKEGFTDDQIKQLKPYFAEKLRATEIEHERSKDAIAAQTRTGVINPRGRDKAATAFDA